MVEHLSTIIMAQVSKAALRPHGTPVMNSLRCRTTDYPPAEIEFVLVE